MKPLVKKGQHFKLKRYPGELVATADARFDPTSSQWYVPSYKLGPKGEREYEGDRWFAKGEITLVRSRQRAWNRKKRRRASKRAKFTLIRGSKKFWL